MGSEPCAQGASRSRRREARSRPPSRLSKVLPQCGKQVLSSAASHLPDQVVPSTLVQLAQLPDGHHVGQLLIQVKKGAPLLASSGTGDQDRWTHPGQ